MVQPISRRAASSGPGRARVGLVLACLFFGLFEVCEAGSLELLAQRWPWRIFDRKDGLIPGLISVIYQDVDDFVYAATERGLCRYNLHHWEVIENSEPFDDGPITRIVESLNLIYCATPRTLWTVQGGNTLRRVYPEKGAVAGPIFVAASKQGEVFLIDEARRTHYRISDRKVSIPDSGVLLPAGAITDYRIDERGAHWLATNLGLHYRSPAQRFWNLVSELDLPRGTGDCRRFLILQKPSQTPLPRGRRLARPRELWGVFQARGKNSDWFLARLEDGAWLPLPGGITGPPVESVTSDTEGNYHVTCEDGRLFFLEPGGDAWRRVEMLGLGPVAKLYGGLLDSRGNLWFRLGAGGVACVRVRSRRWERLPGLPGPPYSEVLGLLETRDGELWIGTDRGCLRYRKSAVEGYEFDPEPISYERISDTDLRKITALGEDRRGRIWLGSESFDGVFSLDPRSGGWERTAISRPIQRIVADVLKELWFLPGDVEKGGGDVELYRLSLFTGDELQAVPIVSSLPDSFPTDRLVVNGLARAQGDVFWLATEVGLLESQLEGGRLVVHRRYTERQGLVSSRIWDVEEGPDGAIWICYPSSGRGVSRLQRDAQGDRVDYFDVRDGLANPDVWAIVRAGQDLWFGTGGGLSRYDGQCWYSFPVASADPYSSLVFSILVPRDPRMRGSLFIGTEEHGVFRFESDDSRRPRFASTEFPQRANKDGTITFRWRARDFKNQTVPAQLIYRFRLDGGGWRVERGIDSVSFTDLEVGEHTFELEVRDLDGNRNRDLILHSFTASVGTVTGPLFVVSVSLGGLLLALLLLCWTVARVRSKRLHARYLSFFTAYPAPVLVVDRQGRIADYNGKLPELLGLKDVRVGDVLGRPVEMIPSLTGFRVGEHVEGAFGGETFQLRAVSAVDHLHPERFLEVRGFPMYRAGDEPREGRQADLREIRAVVIVLEDVTREVEEEGLQFRERRLRGMREFAERMRRDIEELLEPVKEVCQETGERGEKEQYALAERVRRAEGILHDLLAFSRPAAGRDVESTVELDSLLDSLLDLQGNGTGGSLRLGRNVEVDYRSQTALWSVQVERETLREALEAVLANASDAMPERGRLTIRAANLRLEEDPGLLPEGSYVELTIQDSGTGIDPNQLETIFDPFYSTKPRDRARGLGLSRAYGIIRSQGGDIRIRSRPGVGTTVRIFLPARR